MFGKKSQEIKDIESELATHTAILSRIQNSHIKLLEQMEKMKKTNAKLGSKLKELNKR